MVNVKHEPKKNKKKDQKKNRKKQIKRKKNAQHVRHIGSVILLNSKVFYTKKEKNCMNHC